MMVCFQGTQSTKVILPEDQKMVDYTGQDILFKLPSKRISFSNSLPKGYPFQTPFLRPLPRQRFVPSILVSIGRVKSM
jgi:hypothetical protein